MYLYLVITCYEANPDLTNVLSREYMDQDRDARPVLISVSSVLGHNKKHTLDGHSKYSTTHIAHKGRCHLLLLQIRRKLSALCRCQSLVIYLTLLRT